MNLRTYSDPAVVVAYAKREKRRSCSPVKRSCSNAGSGQARRCSILGSAARRGPLSKIASRYIGLDYSQGMVEACRARYPQLEFHHGDATHLSRFEAFRRRCVSANGIDCIRAAEGRAECLREVARVLEN